jgi:predicted nuclease of predicted toxin-antitoxin system
VKLVLDAHYSSRIARQLRGRGYDVIAVSERAELRDLPDEALLRWAQSDGRVLVTEDVRDFTVLHHTFLTRGDLHAGLILTSPRKFSRRMSAVGSLIDALAAFIDAHAEEAYVGQIAWL